VAKVLRTAVTKMLAKRAHERLARVLRWASRREDGRAIQEPDAWRLGYFDARELPEYLIMRSNQERFRRFQQEHRSRANRRFYITVVPKTLDLLEYCLKLLPADLNVFLILNGVADWEGTYLATEFPDIPRFTLEIRDRSILYDRVLDLLMEENEFDFGILDQDCFVLDESLFDQLQFQRNELMMSPFFTHNEKAGIEFPRTYFLYFNVPIVKPKEETGAREGVLRAALPPRSNRSSRSTALLRSIVDGTTSRSSSTKKKDS
jgi:hypothetical protein